MEQCKIQQECEETLPEDMMEEILSRVPVKSLLKFRCVSKSWCYLIDSKRFVKTQFQNSIKNTSVAHHKIILKKRKGLLNEPFDDSITYNSEFILVEGGMIRVVGCCNGLVCILVKRKRFMLWNPATRKSRNLPDFDNKMEYIFKYGFGLDEVSNDYKVFGVALGSNIGRVYSLRSNSWEVVEERDARLVCPFSDDAAIYVSGKLHWFIRNRHDKCDVVSFDLNSHSYGVIELPSYSELGYYWYRIGVHKGCLILVGVHKQQTDYELADIWVMKEYGVKQSWDKLVTVPHDDFLLAIGPNGEVFLSDDLINLNIYDIKCNLFRYPKVINNARLLELGFYIESLASVEPDTEP